MTPATTLTFDGIKQAITEWALDYGIAPAVIIARLERGLPVEEAITRPMVTARGQKLTGKHLDRYIFGQRTAWLRDRRMVIRAVEKASRSAARQAVHDAEKAARAAERKPVRKAARIAKPAQLTTPYPSPANARRYTFNGETLTVRQWSERTGIPATIIANRLRKGWSIERALTEPAGSRRGTVRCDSRLYTFDGKTMTLTQWATELGIRPHTLLKRLKNWSIEDAFTIPVDERKGRGRGVGRNSGESVRTGGPSFAQDRAKLEISPE